jgi:hypothetical protein
MTDGADIKRLIRCWNEFGNSRTHRDELRKMAMASNMKLEDYIEHVFAGGVPVKSGTARDYSGAAYDPEAFPLRAFANELIKCGYDGSGMRDERDAEVKIRAMARGWTDERDMNRGGTWFWNTIRLRFGWWRASQEIEVEEEEDEERHRKMLLKE